MDWQPNEDAVTYFADAILPRIRREVPTVSFAIVGRRPNARVSAVAERAGMLVTGTVDDVRPYIAEAAVYVVPLRAGGGTRLKIFEALAMQKPVVSTTVGAEGLALTPGQEFIAADDPDTFAREVIALLKDPIRRRSARPRRTRRSSKPTTPGPTSRRPSRWHAKRQSPVMKQHRHAVRRSCSSATKAIRWTPKASPRG